MSYRQVKRALDVVASLFLLVILSPLLIIISIWIKLESAGPVLFRQKRYGKDKEPFECLKFRTMYEDAPPDSPTKDMNDSARHISFSGRTLRRIGLDELPQLINVLRGEMSLIGPRPVILAEKDLIRERDKYGANAMLPGIGGWAQSNGRDEIDYKLKARLDGEYAQNFSWRMDVSCIWRTFVAIFTSSGFKEGHIGDTPYKRKVQKNTHRITFSGRVVRRIKKDIGRANKLPSRIGYSRSAIDENTPGKKAKS